MELPSELAGAILEVSDRSSRWFNRFLVDDIPLVCFAPSQITEALRARFRPERSLDVAAKLLMTEIDADDVGDFNSDEFVKTVGQSPVIASLGDLLKERLRYAMYRGVSTSGRFRAWNESLYSKHLDTLVATLGEPKQGLTGSSLVNVASSVYTARMTKRLIQNRYKRTQDEVIESTAPKPMPTPTSMDRELPLGGDGLFTLLFSIIDFIPDDDYEVKFVNGKSDDSEGESSEDATDWVALSFSKAPDFNIAPDTLGNFEHLATAYRQAVQRTVRASKTRESEYWKVDDDCSDKFCLQLFAPKKS